MITFKNPKLPTVKAVYCFNASSIFIFQNPDLRSKQENVQHLPNSPMPPVFWTGSRSPFLCEHSGSRCRYRTIGFHHSFLTNTTALHEALWLGQIAPDSNISHRWFQNLLNQWWGYLSESFFKGSVICYFYHVFRRVSTVQFCRIQQKYIVVLN